MNWTGGDLQRHSRAGGKTLRQRQKAHFAKARANLHQDATHKNISRPVYIAPITAPNEPFARQKHKNLYRHSASGQKHVGLPEHEPGRLVYDPYGGYPDMKTMQQRRKKRDSDRERSPTSARSAYSDLGYGHAKAKTTLVKCRDTVQFTSAPELDHIESRRGELLAQGDWIGLSLARSHKRRDHMPVHRGDIAKRRRISRAQRTVLPVHHGDLAHRRLRESDDEPGTSSNLPTSRIRVVIGSAALASHIGSVSQQQGSCEQLPLFAYSHSLGDDDRVLQPNHNIYDESLVPGRETLFASISGGTYQQGHYDHSVERPTQITHTSLVLHTGTDCGVSDAQEELNISGQKKLWHPGCDAEAEDQSQADRPPVRFDQLTTSGSRPRHITPSPYMLPSKLEAFMEPARLSLPAAVSGHADELSCPTDARHIAWRTFLGVEQDSQSLAYTTDTNRNSPTYEQVSTLGVVETSDNACIDSSAGRSSTQARPLDDYQQIRKPVLRAPGDIHGHTAVSSDDIWRRFVFGSEADQTARQADHQTRSPTMLFSSSNDARPLSVWSASSIRRTDGAQKGSSTEFDVNGVAY